jgi:hypothetical protein
MLEEMTRKEVTAAAAPSEEIEKEAVTEPQQEVAQSQPGENTIRRRRGAKDRK